MKQLSHLDELLDNDIGHNDHVRRLARIVISPTASQFPLGLAQFWEWRHLVWVFLWRDVKVRYKQTLLGVGWILLQPLLSMLVLTVVFGRMVKVPTGGMPYSVFVLSGLLPWQLFARGLTRSSNCLVDNQYLLTGAFVPRLTLPVAAVLSALVDFGIEFVLLLLVMAVYDMHPGVNFIFAVPLLLLALLVSLGLGLFFSALNVRYRDVGYTLPFFLQLWFFVTPVVYSGALIPAHWRWVYSLNPLTPVVEGFRWSILGNPVPTSSTFMTAGVTTCLLFLALLYFRSVEREFADVV